MRTWKSLYMPTSLKQQEFDRQLDLTQIRQFRRTGDLEVLGNVYKKYMHLVYGVGLKYFKDRDKASDLVMHVFEKLTVEAKKQEVSNFRSWLYVVAKNECLMELRKQNSEEERFKKWQQDENSFMDFSMELHPLDDEDNRLTDALVACIAKLKEEQKSCIDLFYFKKKSYREIAITLKLEEKKVKSFIQNGKRNLKICIESSNV